MGMLLSWLAKILVVLFFIGLIGSAVVIVITFFEDGQLLMEGDEPAPGTSDVKLKESPERSASTAHEAF